MVNATWLNSLYLIIVSAYMNPTAGHKPRAEYYNFRISSHKTLYAYIESDTKKLLSDSVLKDF